MRTTWQLTCPRAGHPKENKESSTLASSDTASLPDILWMTRDSSIHRSMNAKRRGPWDHLTDLLPQSMMSLGLEQQTPPPMTAGPAAQRDPGPVLSLRLLHHFHPALHITIQEDGFPWRKMPCSCPQGRSQPQFSEQSLTGSATLFLHHLT